MTYSQSKAADVLKTVVHSLTEKVFGEDIVGELRK